MSSRHAQEHGYDRLPFMRLLVDRGRYEIELSVPGALEFAAMLRAMGRLEWPARGRS